MSVVFNSLELGSGRAWEYKYVGRASRNAVTGMARVVRRSGFAKRLVGGILLYVLGDATVWKVRLRLR